MKNQNNKFRFFAPVDDFQKSKDPKGNEIYKVRGIISDDSFDSDGESLAEEGLDFSEFNWINWDHKKEPKFLIGEPIGVKRIPGKGHFMEGVLYGDSEVAKQAIDLMKILSKSKRGNKLSWSVEGQVLERDLINPKKVRKAKITAVALCPTPKNGNTWAELIQKGFSEESYQKPEDLEYEVNGGDIVVIDEDGDKITISADGDIKIDKAQDTSNSRALIPEDVEGNEKKLEKSILVSEVDFEDLKKSVVVIAEAHKEGLISNEEAVENLFKFKKFIKIDS